MDIPAELFRWVLKDGDILVITMSVNDQRVSI